LINEYFSLENARHADARGDWQWWLQHNTVYASFSEFEAIHAR